MSTRRQHFCLPNIGSWGSQILRASWLPGLWNRGECAWARRKGLETHCFPPKASHKHPVQTNAFQVQGTLLRALRCLGGCPLRKEALLGTPAPGEFEASWILPSNSWRPSCHMGLWSRNIADSSPLKRVQRRALCQDVSTPPQSSSGTPACSASRDGIASQVREVDKRAGTPFLSSLADATLQNSWFAMLWLLSVYSRLTQYYISMGYLYCVFLDLCHRSSSEVLSIRSLWNIYLRWSFLWIIS